MSDKTMQVSEQDERALLQKSDCALLETASEILAKHGYSLGSRHITELLARLKGTPAAQPKREIPPEMKAAIEEAQKTGAASALLPNGSAVFINYGHDYGDNDHLCCTACGGSGHIEDQQALAASPAPSAAPVQRKMDPFAGLPVFGMAKISVGHPDHFPGEFIRLSDARIALEYQLGAAPSQVAQTSEPVELYTCKGKGGEYEWIGTAYPAGFVRQFFSDPVEVYRSTTDRSLYFRECGDFNKRMERIAAPVAPSRTKQADQSAIVAELAQSLRWALEWIDAVPGDTPLPTMPGFDRGYVNELLADVNNDCAAHQASAQEGGE